MSKIEICTEPPAHRLASLRPKPAGDRAARVPHRNHPDRAPRSRASCCLNFRSDSRALRRWSRSACSQPSTLRRTSRYPGPPARASPLLDPAAARLAGLARHTCELSQLKSEVRIGNPERRRAKARTLRVREAGVLRIHGRGFPSQRITVDRQPDQIAIKGDRFIQSLRGVGQISEPNDGGRRHSLGGQRCVQCAGGEGQLYELGKLHPRSI